MRLLTLVGTLLLLTTAACGRGDGDNTDSGRAGIAENTRCLVPPPLLGLRLGDSTDALRTATRQPIGTARSSGQYDGRREAEIIYRFPRADVRFVRGRVNRIIATEAGGWPRGLRVGSTRSEVDQYAAEHRLLRMTSGNAIEIAVCPDNRMLLHLAPAAGDRRVSRVELLANRI
jgi:hypothetical protein